LPHTTVEGSGVTDPLAFLSADARAAIEQLVDARVEQRLAEIDPRRADGWPEWMSVETAARYLDVSEERVRKFKDRRAIPYYQEAPNCRVFFCRAELDQWMHEARVMRVR
jgi:Helix-turn-helix domain